MTAEMPCWATAQGPALLGGRLTRLDLNVFTLVTNPLALVRLRLSRRSDFCGELTDELLVAAFHYNMRLV